MRIVQRRDRSPHPLVARAAEHRPSSSTDETKAVKETIELDGQPLYC